MSNARGSLAGVGIERRVILPFLAAGPLGGVGLGISAGGSEMTGAGGGGIGADLAWSLMADADAAGSISPKMRSGDMFASLRSALSHWSLNL